MIKFDNLDLIAPDINFKIFGKSKFNTTFGAILSLMIVTLITSFSIFLIIELINKSTPSLNMSKLYSNNPILIDFSHDFPVMLSVIKRGIIYIDNPDSYFTITAYSVNNNITLNSQGQNITVNKFNPINITKCSNELINSNFGKYSQSFIEAAHNPNLEQLYCLPLGQNLSYLSGVYGSSPFNYIDFSINFCNNSTSKVTCQPFEIIQSTLANVFVLAIFPDYYVDPYNPDSPANYYLKTQVYPISSKFYKRYYFVYKKIQFTTDIGIVFEDLKTQKFFQYDILDKDMNINVQGLTPDTFAEFSFVQYSNVYDYYFRSYKKAASILAEVGGALNALMVIASTVNYYFHSKMSQIQIFEQFCSEGDQIKSNEKIESNNKLKSLNILDKSNIPQDKIEESKSNFSQEKSSSIHLQNFVGNIYAGNKMGNKGRSELKNKLLPVNFKLINHLNFIDLTLDYRNLRKLNVGYYDLICCWRRSRLKKQKIDLAKKLSDQIIDFNFIFVNLLRVYEIITENKFHL